MATLHIYDEIGEWGIDAKAVAREIGSLKDDEPLEVHINSPGGSAFDGIAIYNQLRRRGGVSVIVDGIAASAASIIAMGGQTITMAHNSMMMIHRASAGVWGNAQDLRDVADALDALDGQIVDTYAKRVGDSMQLSVIHELLDAETWLTAQDAVDRGFADAIDGEGAIPAAVHKGRYKNTPEHLRTNGGSVERVLQTLEQRRIQSTVNRLRAASAKRIG